MNAHSTLDRAFAKVRFQVVARRNDGSEIIANAITRASADKLASDHRAMIGKPDRIDPTRHVVSVEVREV